MRLTTIAVTLACLSIGIATGEVVGLVYLALNHTGTKGNHLLLVLSGFLVCVAALLCWLAIEIEIHTEAEEVKTYGRKEEHKARDRGA